MRFPHLVPGQFGINADEFNYAFEELERIRNFFSDGSMAVAAGGVTTARSQWPRMVPQDVVVQRTRIMRIVGFLTDIRPFWPGPGPVAFAAREVDKIGGSVIDPDADPIALHALRWPFTDFAGIELPLSRYLPQIPHDVPWLSDVPTVKLPIDPDVVTLYTFENTDPPPTERWYVRGLFTGYCI